MSHPAPLGQASTHVVEVGTDVVTKRYVSGDRGEHLREAAALRHLGREAPGLAPRLLGHSPPSVRPVPDASPWLRMTRVTGQKVEGPWTPLQLEGLVTAHERLATLDSTPVMGQGDPNVANFLHDDTVVRLVDFEDAGRSTQVYELANLLEHLANRDAGFEAVIGCFDVSAADLLLCRRLIATWWFVRLSPGGASRARNPPGTFEAQGRRLRTLLQGQ